MGHIGNPRSFRLSHRRRGYRLMNMPGLLDYKLKSWLKASPVSTLLPSPALIAGEALKGYRLKRWFARAIQTPRLYQNRVRRTLIHSHPSWNQLWFNRYNYSASFFPFFSANGLFSSKKSFFNFSLRKKVQQKTSPGGFFSHSILFGKPNDQVIFRPIYVSKYLNNLKQYYPDYISVANNQIFSSEQKPFLKGSLLYERKAFAQPRISEKVRHRSFKEGYHITKYLTRRIRLEAVQDKLYHLLADNIGRRAYFSEVLRTPYKHYQVPNNDQKKLILRTGPGRFHKKHIYFQNNMDIKYLKDPDVLYPLYLKHYIYGVGVPHAYFSDSKKSEIASIFLEFLESSVKDFFVQRNPSFQELFSRILSKGTCYRNLRYLTSVSRRASFIDPKYSQYGFFTKEFIEQLDKNGKSFAPSLERVIFTKKGRKKTAEKIQQHRLWERKKAD